MTAVALQCPKCSGPMWDETKSKYFKPGRPIAKCKDKACTGVLWAPKDTGVQQPAPIPITVTNHGAGVAAMSHGQLVTESLDRLFGLYDLCYGHASSLAKRSSGPDTVVTVDGISRIAATLFIQACDRGLV